MLSDTIWLRAVVESALKEDIGTGDITSMLTVPEQAVSRAVISVREDGVIAGMDAAEMAFSVVDPHVRFEKMVSDGDRVSRGQALAVVEGRSRSLLAGERIALNFLQRLSGIATKTAYFVSLVEGTKAKVVDTRKTTPGLRALEKYAVRVGGGYNHRFGLYDGVLIKDNHIIAAGGVRNAVTAAKAGAPHTLKVEVEVRTLDELTEALDSGADAVLLDNMDIETMRQAVEITAGRAVLEASGGVTEQTIADIAATGVDLISVGALTHSVKSLDIGLDFEK
ncbi:MAG TPA: carboxylating nicotinate-nucleotide diphosphorylase [Armatimonadota bacterium]|nr:carboxylating nicotinate-nucleotide diphosphorylase [Armatimonadota bacterium]